MDGKQSEIQHGKSDTTQQSSATVLPRGSSRPFQQANPVKSEVQDPHELRRLEFTEEVYGRVYKIRATQQCDCSQPESRYEEGTAFLFDSWKWVSILYTALHCVRCTDCGKLFKGVTLIFLGKGIQNRSVVLRHYESKSLCFNGNCGEILTNSLPLAVILILTRRPLQFDIKRLPQLLSADNFERLFPERSSNCRSSTGREVTLVAKPVMEPSVSGGAAHNLYYSMGHAWRKDGVLHTNCKSAPGMSGGCYVCDVSSCQYFVGIHEKAALHSHTTATALTQDIGEQIKEIVCSSIPPELLETVDEKQFDAEEVKKTASMAALASHACTADGADAASLSLQAHDSGLICHQRHEKASEIPEERNEWISTLQAHDSGNIRRRRPVKDSETQKNDYNSWRQWNDSSANGTKVEPVESSSGSLQAHDNSPICHKEPVKRILTSGSARGRWVDLCKSKEHRD